MSEILTLFNNPFFFVSLKSGRPQRGSREQLYLEALEESGDQFTFIVVVSLAVCGTLLLLVIVVLMVYMCHKKDKQLKGGSKLTTGSASSSQQKAPSEGILFLFIFCLYRLFLMRSTSLFSLIYFIKHNLEDFYTFCTSKFYSNILMLEVGKLKTVSHQILFRLKK